MDKEQKRESVIDVAFPADSNRKKEQEKIKKYQGLKEQVEQMRWMSKVVPVGLGALGTVSPSHWES